MVPPPPADDPALSSGSQLEDLVAAALEALDRGGEAALEALLAEHPTHREQVLALITQFRHTGLLARDARSDIPERLGDFRLLQRLGGGGMGVVFTAEQESLGRKVALKVIRPDLLFFEGARERFRREIQVIARLSHPAIVPIVSTGEHNDVPWYAMALIEGCSADEVVRRLHARDVETLSGEDLRRAILGDSEASGKSSTQANTFGGSYWEACLHLIRQAALGLAHAHERGIVHRDVKPSNVMLTPDGRALLLDFGLALVQGDARLTRAGGEPGSPAYMAPEQIRGVGADERSDVYSLAATLFQLLDLAAPFAAPDQEHLRQKILHGQGAVLRNRTVPRELRLVLAVAMDLDRERRYTSAEAFAADLGAVLARRPISARRLPVRIRLVRWGQRHRTLAVSAAILSVLAMVLPAVLVWQRGKALEVLAAEKQRVERSRDLALAAVSEFLVKFTSNGLAALPRGQHIGADLLARAVNILDQMHGEGDSPELRFRQAEVEHGIVASLHVAGRIAEARTRALAMLAAWPDREKAPPEVAIELAAVRIELLRMHVTGVTTDGIEKIVEQAKADLDRADHEPTLANRVLRQRAELMSCLGILEQEAGDAKGGEQAMQESLDLLAREPNQSADRRALMATMRNRIADRKWDSGDIGTAESLFRETVKLLQPIGDRTSGRPEDLRLWGYAVWGLAHVAMSRQQYDESVRCYEQAVQLYEASAFAYPDDASVIQSFACILTEYGQMLGVAKRDPAIGIPLLERARGLFRRIGAGSGGGDAATHQQTNLRTLCTIYGKQHDAGNLASVAREIAASAAGAENLATAAWNLLIAAGWLETAGKADDAHACDEDAMKALLACDKAGWFPPVDLDDSPCRRIEGDARFVELRQRHPPEAASRARSNHR